MTIRKIETIKAGDMIDLDERDVKYLKILFEETSSLRRAAEVFMNQSFDSAKKAWKAFYDAYPVFKDYAVIISYDNKVLIVKEIREEEK